MRPRILFPLDQLELAGSKTRALNISRSLDRSRFQVPIVWLHASEPLQPEIESAGIDRTSQYNLKLQGAVPRLLERILHPLATTV